MLCSKAKCSVLCLGHSNPMQRCWPGEKWVEEKDLGVLVGRHRAERVLNSEVPCVRYLDRSDREDV